MRINIEWVAPWMHRPLRTWIFHKWYRSQGTTRGKSAGGITLLGFRMMFSMDAYWTGITLSMNIYDARPKHIKRPILFNNVEVDWWSYPMRIIKSAFAENFNPTDENAWNEFKQSLAEASRRDPLLRTFHGLDVTDREEE